MPIGLTDDHRALVAAIGDWAGSAGTIGLVRGAEDPAQRGFADAWKSLAALGVPVIAVPESLGGGGGSVVDLAVALEACASHLAPGPLLSTAVVGTLLARVEPLDPVRDLLRLAAEGSVTFGLAIGSGPGPDPGPGLGGMSGEPSVLSGDLPVVLGAGASHLLVGEGERWYVMASDQAGVVVANGDGPDLSRAVGSVRLDAVPATPVAGLDERVVRRTFRALAAAELAGTTRWCLDAAVEHAKVREQFGRPIGSFQAVKHLCAGMLESVEAVAAAAWDAAVALGEEPEQSEPAAEAAQADLASAVAAAVAADAGVAVCNDCVQVLGGIGFTWEHDAHLHLRRAIATRALLGGPGPARAEVAELAISGVRRRHDLDVDDPELRTAVRKEAADIAALPVPQQRQALVEAGLFAAHWPVPYGRGAGPVAQLVIGEELTAAGLEPADLVVGGWAAPTILEHGTDEQRERFVGPTLTGEIGWCQLFSEPGAGSDLAALRTRAVRVEGGGPGGPVAGWSITGQKVWTSLAQEADWAICLARTDPEAPKHRGITYFLVDMSSSGIEVRPLREMTGDALFNEVFLDDVFVPDSLVVGEPGDGWRLTRTTLTNERVAMAGSQLGASVEKAVRWAAGSDVDPVSLDRLGALVADATVLASLDVRTTLRSLAGVGPGPESSVAKLLGTRNRQESAQLAVDLLGARAALGSAGHAGGIGAEGVGDEPAAEAVRELLHTRCLTIAGGTTQILRNVIAERILGLPRD